MIPTGDPPAGDALAASNGLFMSDDGRTFFSTKAALVPFDTNGKVDVYEYTEGRPQLISSGTASTDTWGGGLLIYPAMTVGLEGVSADGVDVYFSTFDTLVPQDHNGEFIKFYDARTGGGFPFQAPPPPCKAADECHGVGSVGPASPQVGTGAQLGKTGNVRSTKCKKGTVKKNGKCVKKKKARRRRSERRSDRGAGPMAERARDRNAPDLRLALSVLALVVAGVCGALLPGVAQAATKSNISKRSRPPPRPAVTRTS